MTLLALVIGRGLFPCVQPCPFMTFAFVFESKIFLNGLPLVLSVSLES